MPENEREHLGPYPMAFLNEICFDDPEPRVLSFITVKDWHYPAETIRAGKRQYLQIIYAYNEGGRARTFLVRRYGRYQWKAIALKLPTMLAGMIFATGQSDTDCVRNARKFIEHNLLGAPYGTLNDEGR